MTHSSTQSVHVRDSFVRRHRSFFVGLFVIIPVVTIVALLSYTLVTSTLFKPWLRFHAFYDQNLGVAKGNGVSISGMAIGHVNGVTLVREGCVNVIFKVDPAYRRFVKKDTRALLSQKNLVVGDWEIQLTGGSDSAGLAADGDTLVGDYSLRIDKMTGQIADMIEQVGQIVRGISDGKGNLGRLLTEDSLVRQVQGIMTNVNGITVQSARMMRQVDSLLATLNKAGATGAGLADSVAALMTTVQKSLGDAAVVMENVKDLSGNFAPMVNRVQDNLDQVEVMMRGLQNNWLVRQAVGKPEDKLLKEGP